MTIKDLKTCLFFTINEDNLKQVQELGNKSNETKYYTTIKFKNDWYMINAKHYTNFFCKDNINDYIKSIENKQEESYYNATDFSDSFRILLTDENLKLFNFAFDLRDCIILDGREREEYKKEDVINLQLDSHLPFSTILTLIKKGTKKDNLAIQGKILETFARKTSRPSFNEKSYKEALKEFENLDDVNEELFEEFKIYANKLKEIEEEYLSIQDRLKLINIENGRLK